MKCKVENVGPLSPRSCGSYWSAPPAGLPSPPPTVCRPPSSRASCRAATMLTKMMTMRTTRTNLTQPSFTLTLNSGKLILFMRFSDRPASSHRFNSPGSTSIRGHAPSHASIRSGQVLGVKGATLQTMKNAIRQHRCDQILKKLNISGLSKTLRVAPERSVYSSRKTYGSTRGSFLPKSPEKRDN